MTQRLSKGSTGMKCSCRRDDKDPCSDSKLYSKIETKKLDSWKDITREYEKLGTAGKQWVFRGQKCCSWGLETEFERSLKKFAPKATDYSKIEGGLIRLFKRQFRQFGLPSPRENDYMEWIALMRHYGAPTRILDWTYSFYAALFFAVEKAEAESAVWALDTKWTDRQCKKKYPAEWKLVGTGGSDPNARCFTTFKKVFLAKKSFVVNMNSYNQNQRLVIQQGTFLFPGNIEAPFEKNLLVFAGGESLRDKVIKYVITGDAGERREILKQLYCMNMNRATLFPGLDGFAGSLKTRLLFPELLIPDPNWQSWLKKKR